MNEDFGEQLLNNGFTPFNIEKLDRDKILDEETFEYIFAIEDNIARTRLIVQLQEKAKELKVIRSFDKLFKAYQQNYIQNIKTQNSKEIQFTNSPIPNLKCRKMGL